MQTICQEVTDLNNTNRGKWGFGSTDRQKIQIQAISTKTLQRTRCKEDINCPLWGRYVNRQMKHRATNLSTELALWSKKDQQKKDIHKIVPEEYSDYLRVLERRGSDNATTPLTCVDLQIEIEKGKRPPLKKIYPLRAKELEKLGEYIWTNKERGSIYDSFTDGGSPIMFVKKKDSKLRLFVHYRELNNITKKDRYPLPLIGEGFDRHQGAKLFTKLDIKGAYHNIWIREGYEWKTTFTTKLETYKYLVMHFGLCNAPAAFQR